jgi:hypothetical protein
MGLLGLWDQNFFSPAGVDGTRIWDQKFLTPMGVGKVYID